MADVGIFPKEAGNGADQVISEARTGTGADRREDHRPRSDWGTIILHWTATIAMIASLVTGLRISADAEGSIFAKAIQVILPQGEIWTVHFIAAITLIGTIFAYPLYMTLAGLRRRAAISKVAVLTMPASRKMKWGAFNVALHWLLFLDVLVMGGTGVALYIGYGGWVVQVHYVAALVALAYIAVHLFSHFMFGGIWQWLRLFRPARLASAQIAQPTLVAIGVGAVIAGAFAAADVMTEQRLRVGTISTPPKLDGVLEDEAWKAAVPVTVHTMQGVHPATGESDVEIRAVHDANRIYFAFRWQDPTRSLKRLPTIKKEDGWHLIHNKADIADESLFYEDKFAVMLAKSDAFGAAGTTHMGPKPLADKPGSLNERGSHYTTDGSLVDIWQWKATRGGQLGFVDDLWFGTPTKPTPDMEARKVRYQVGYDSDKGKAFYSYNYVVEPPGGFKGPIKLRKLPKDYRAIQARLGDINLDPEKSDPEGQKWWMTADEIEDYTEAKDKEIPVGTVLPATLIAGPYEGSRSDVTGGVTWKDGYWTLETSRVLDSKQPDDVAIADGLNIWVSVFDHNQTRHTRHMRPVKLELH